MDHPSEETLKCFAAGTASREENRSVVAHLLKGCSVCAKRLRGLMEPESVSHGTYEAALDRFDQGLIERLEGSIDPRRALRAAMRDLPLDPREERARKKR
jgi:hypothetical protein